MNSLSWFIYLTQLVDNLSDIAQTTLIAGIIFGGFSLIFAPMILDLVDSEIPLRKAVIGFVTVMVVALIAYIITPNRQTMIMIAGSEMGERIAKSGDVQSVVNPGMELIRKWIKQESDKIKDKS